MWSIIFSVLFIICVVVVVPIIVADSIVKQLLEHPLFWRERAEYEEKILVRRLKHDKHFLKYMKVIEQRERERLKELGYKEKDLKTVWNKSAGFYITGKGDEILYAFTMRTGCIYRESKGPVKN